MSDMGTINVNSIWGNGKYSCMFNYVFFWLHQWCDLMWPCTLYLQGAGEAERGAAVSPPGAQRQDLQVFRPQLWTLYLNSNPLSNFPTIPLLIPFILPQVMLFLCSPIPWRGERWGILVSAESCSRISWGDHRLGKVLVTQQRVLCEAGATDGSTPELAWSHVSHTHVNSCAQRHAHAVEVQRHRGTCTGVHPNPHVYTHGQTHTKSLLSFMQASDEHWCVFSHAVCPYSFSTILVYSITLSYLFPLSHSSLWSHPVAPIQLNIW